MALTPAISLVDAISGSYQLEGACGEYRAVVPGTDEDQVKIISGAHNADGCPIEGVLQDEQLNGEVGKVVLFGPTWAWAGGAISRGNPIIPYSDAADPSIDGSFVAVGAGAIANGKMVSGIALEDALKGARFKIFL